jgi:predicted MPP superfamily phosphohydrolase
MTRRNFFCGAGGAAVGSYSYAYYFEPSWLESTEKRVAMARGRLRRPLRILHLSDLHASEYIPLRYLREAFAQGLAARPDLICLTGDFITSATDYDEAAYIEALKALTAAAPVYAVPGNHDGGDWAARSGWYPSPDRVMAMLGKAGVRVLLNRSATVETAAGTVHLVGLGDWWSNNCLAGAAFAGVPRGEAPVVCLNHNPDGKQECPDAPWELMLCGHTHGGQVHIPFYGPARVAVLDERYAVGLNPFAGGRWIHTTRGVGNILGFRVNCRPELSTLVLT